MLSVIPSEPSALVFKAGSVIGLGFADSARLAGKPKVPPQFVPQELRLHSGRTCLFYVGFGDEALVVKPV